MKTCNTCGHPTTRGHSGSDARGTTCLVCWTEKTMRDFHYPASQKQQRVLRKEKAHRHAR